MARPEHKPKLRQIFAPGRDPTDYSRLHRPLNCSFFIFGDSAAGFPTVQASPIEELNSNGMDSKG
jgi:hypothetical protein